MRFTDTATITTKTVGARSGGHNNPTTTTATTTETGLFQQQATTERLDNQDLTVSRGIWFGPYNTALTPTSTFTVDTVPNRTFRVIGDPSRLKGLGGGLPHSETVVEAVTSS